MSIGLFIFIFYIVIILFNWLLNQAKKSHTLNQEDESINSTSVNQDKISLPEYSNNINIKDANNVEKNEKIIIDDEVREFYEEKETKTFPDKPLIVDKEEVISKQEGGLREYLPDNILINGIILSEIIALPRALRPYKFRRHKRLGDYKV